MHDLVIDNARIVDGSGAPARHGSVAVSDGRIVAVDGRGGEAARERLDAGGLVLAPGFIDPHTHYDAQLAWDPLVTSSSWHGVTTVVTGNCGVGVAPCRPDAREILMNDLVNVEAIPLDVGGRRLLRHSGTRPSRARRGGRPGPVRSGHRGRRGARIRA
jgi:N-acyl-D-amino-acid deacylase